MSITLTQNIKQPTSKNLVFTSAGDNSNLECWLKGKSNFDLWISYYGNTTGKFSTISEYYMAKKGGKFPGLHYVYSHWKEIVDKYDAVFVMDDDLIISGDDIRALFSVREKYDLWLLQPAFDHRGKVSHRHTKTHFFSYLRYTNFIEVTCPLFRKDKLDTFMSIYDPVVIGWGIDWWYSDTLLNKEGAGKRGAVVDAISCINPKDNYKRNGREISNLQSDKDRMLCWEKIKKEKSVYFDTKDIQVFSSEPLRLNFINGQIFFKRAGIKHYCKLCKIIRKFSRQRLSLF